MPRLLDSICLRVRVTTIVLSADDLSMNPFITQGYRYLVFVVYLGTEVGLFTHILSHQNLRIVEKYREADNKVCFSRLCVLHATL